MATRIDQAQVESTLAAWGDRMSAGKFGALPINEVREILTALLLAETDFAGLDESDDDTLLEAAGWLIDARHGQPNAAKRLANSIFVLVQLPQENIGSMGRCYLAMSALGFDPHWTAR